MHPVINWDAWLGSQAGQPDTIWANVDVTWNAAQSTMDVSVTVPYIGESTAQGGKPRGFTYVIDFDNFPSNGRSISETNSCQNSESSSFLGRSFPAWWQFADKPWVPGQVGNASTNMEYGPANGWTQTVSVPANVDNATESCECVNITFTRSFTLTELGQCTIRRPATNNKAFTWVEDNVALNFSGTLHVTAVSNFFTNADYEYYAKSIAAVPIRVRYQKALHVVGSANVRNYGVMPQGIEFDSVTGTVVISLITWNPYFVRFDVGGATLLSPSVVNFPFIEGLHSITETPYVHASGTYGDCMLTTPLRCFQRTVIGLNVSNSCPNGNNIVLTDQYRLDMSLHCNSTEFSAQDTDECNNYLSTGNIKHVLVQELQFNLPCDGVDLSGALSGELRFYETSSYTNQITTVPDYLAEVDTAYIEIALSGSTPTTFEILEVKLVSVYLCTISQGDMSGMDPVTGDGGCIENVNVENGPLDKFYVLFMNGLPNNNLDTTVALVNSGGVDKVRFQFQVPIMNNRPVFYVHAQVQVSVLNSTSPIRRLLSVGGNSASGTTAFNNAQGQAKITQQPSVTGGGPQPTPTMPPTIIVIIVLVVVICVIFGGIGFWCWNEKRKAAETERDAAENTVSQGTFQINIAKSPGARHKVNPKGVSVESATTTPLRMDDHEDDLVGPAPGSVFGVSANTRVV